MREPYILAFSAIAFWAVQTWREHKVKSSIGIYSQCFFDVDHFRQSGAISAGVSAGLVCFGTVSTSEKSLSDIVFLGLLIGGVGNGL